MTARSCASRTEKLARPDARGQTLLVRQQLEHDRGRGQRQAGAEDDRLRGLLPGHRGGAGDQGGGEQHLQAAEPEDQRRMVSRRWKRQFETDQEQQEDDAELGDAGDVLGVADGEPIKERI